MKIFKRFLIIGFFSLLFIFNVKADTYSLKYSESNIQRYEEFKQLIDNAREYSLSNNLIDNSKIVYYDFSYFSYNLIRVYYLTGNYNASNRRFYRQVYDLSFNSNYNITSYSSGSSGYFEDSMSNIINHGYFDYNFGSSTSYTITMDVDTLVGSNGGLLMYANQPVNFYTFVQALSFDISPPPENPNKCLISNQIGVTRNISSLTFRVVGVTNALDYPLEGFFDISTKSFLNNTSYDWKTFVNVVVNDIQSDDEYDVDYSLDWITGTTSDYLRLNYKITAIDDIDTNIDVSFTLTSRDVIFDPFFKNELLIFGCPPNNIYSNISYGYTDDDSGISYSSDSVLSNWLQDNSVGNISPLINTDLIGEGPVDSILLLPLNIMQSLLNVLNSNTCQPLVLPLPHLNRNITLPCINTLYSQINGLSTFLNWFSTIISAFILYEYFIRLYKWVDNLLTFRENNHFGGF